MSDQPERTLRGIRIRLRKSLSTALKHDEIDWLVEVGWLTPWEERFLRGTAHRIAGNFSRFVAPSASQLATRCRINELILAWIDGLEGTEMTHEPAPNRP